MAYLGILGFKLCKEVGLSENQPQTTNGFHQKKTLFPDFLILGGECGYYFPILALELGPNNLFLLLTPSWSLWKVKVLVLCLP